MFLRPGFMNRRAAVARRYFLIHESYLARADLADSVARTQLDSRAHQGSPIVVPVRGLFAGLGNRGRRVRLLTSAAHARAWPFRIPGSACRRRRAA